MKRLLSILLIAACIIFLLAGCGHTPPVETQDTGTSPETTQSAQTTNPPETTESVDDTIPISVARGYDDGSSITASGVVAKITYSYGMHPSGFLLVDNTASIYVYGAEAAAQVKEGNTVKLTGNVTHWILDKEQENAATYGYNGCLQLENPEILHNDEGNSAFHTGWITETTVKAIMDTPVTEDITTQLFKVTALIKKVEGTGFTNYYINDLDGATGSYCYSQCSGSDFAWLDAFDGKICTVYLTAFNAKSGASGCLWRFLPVAVEDNGFDASAVDAAKFVAEYYGIPQFQTQYTGDPALELLPSVDVSLLNITGAALSYTSSDETVVYFENNVMHCAAPGSAEITVTCTYADKTHSQNVTIQVSQNAQVAYISVSDAIAASVGDTVTVKGIVGPSLVNRDGFYLIDDEALIAITTDQQTLETLTIGDEIVLEGTRDRFHDGSGNHAGQTAITHCTVISNSYGDHNYCTDFFVTDKSLADFYKLDASEDYSTTVFVVTATVDVVETAYYTKIQLKDGATTVSLYCANANQYAFLKDYAGQEVTVELAACNWNNKTFWAGCVLAVRLEDGTKIINELNFR